MYCAHCGRRLTRPAFAAPASAGGWALGPVCLSRPAELAPEIRHVLLNAKIIQPHSARNYAPAAPKKRQRSAKKKRVKKIKQVARNDDQFDLFLG